MTVPATGAVQRWLAATEVTLPRALLDILILRMPRGDALLAIETAYGCAEPEALAIYAAIQALGADADGAARQPSA
jgi:hypothetical protein